jgi:uncharacterized protein YdeI (YjbR/CyaY-like superfamily)
MQRNNNYDEFISKQDQWKSTLNELRKIILSTGLDETIKWGTPVYTHGGKNIVGIGSFKSYAGLWFFQGALLKDEKKKLINAQEGITKALRQWRIDSVEEVENESKLIKNYVEEAILNKKQGKEIKPAKEKITVISPVLNRYLDSNPNVKASFYSFSSAKQREYAEYINEAKKIETKNKRMDKIKPLILKKKGLDEKYKK